MKFLHGLVPALFALAACDGGIGIGETRPIDIGGAQDLGVGVGRGGGGGGGGGGNGGGGGGGGSSSVLAFCVEETNMYRATLGKPPVARSAELEAFANEGASYDFSHSPHSHFGMGGGIAFGENECPHWDVSFGGGDMRGLMAACIKAFWDEGPGGGHYEIMTGGYGNLGCGLYQEGSEVTIIQDYR